MADINVKRVLAVDGRTRHRPEGSYLTALIESLDDDQKVLVIDDRPQVALYAPSLLTQTLEFTCPESHREYGPEICPVCGNGGLAEEFADGREKCSKCGIVSRRNSYEPFKRDKVKTKRNDPCPCGSGKKYKKCCGR